MNKAVIIFTEGNDDIAFLSRVLKTAEFKKCLDKIKELIYPLNERIKAHINDIYPLEYQIEESETDISVNEIKMSIPKIYTKSKDEDKYYLIFYAIGGKSTIKERAVSIIEKYLPVIFTPDFRTNEDKISIEEYSFAFFFDADENKSKTIEYIQESLKSVLESEIWAHNNCFNGKLKYRDNDKETKIACYIFPSEEIGSLECIVLPMMIKGVDDNRFIEAKNYYNKYKTTQTIPQRIKRAKAVIGIAGQLEKEARPNSALYEDGVYYKKQISDNKQCKEIVGLINSLFE
ncbi:MAG: hypothetical protein B6I20_04270 [Bacteroidetes bacterium 4572_117]|nr:MAG: hypothetical protein B6I20_04270 [Bacteroidetes bacterium 4572_117]